MRIAFRASIAPIIRDPVASHAFYRGTLGLSFEGGAGDYVFTDQLGGARHFGLWPLREAAQACFGAPAWPADIPEPQASLEFEVETIAAAAAAATELAARGDRLLHGARTGPWAQTIARPLSPEGLIVGVCYTPQFQDGARDDR